jgi:hypothetical protein
VNDSWEKSLKPIGQPYMREWYTYEHDGNDPPPMNKWTKHSLLVAVYPFSDIETLRDKLSLAIGKLTEIKNGSGRAEILGTELFRCPQCASAEIANEAPGEIKMIDIIGYTCAVIVIVVGVLIAFAAVALILLAIMKIVFSILGG